MKGPLTPLEIDPGNWRPDILALLLKFSAGLGFLVYLPSVWAAYRDGLFGLILLDTVALTVILGLHRFERGSYRLRATIYCLICYLLAVGLLTSVGPISQIYLFGYSLLTTVLLGLRAGFRASLLSAATLFAVGASGRAAPDMTLPFRGQDLTGWAVITLNFALVNTLLSLAVGAVLSVLNRAFEREVAARISLDQERQLLRTLIDALPDVVYTKDTAGRYVNCNAATLALLGLEHESQAAGKTVFELFPAELAATYHADDMEAIAGRTLRNREVASIGPGGESIRFLTIKVPLRNSDGTIVGLIGIGRDVTELKQAEAERARASDRLQLQIERMPLAYLLSDADFRYVRWNRTAERMFGFSEAEILGKHPLDVIVPPQSQALVSDIFEKIKAGNMEAHGESENLTKDGRTIVCEWHNTPLFEENGTFVGMMSLAQDVTARKQLETQLRQSQKMDAIGRLAGGVAHDFNNLLTVVSGYCELLLDRPDLDDSVREPVEAIRDAGERAAALTRQLLGFGRQTLLQPKILDLNAVVVETGKLLRRLIGEDIRFSLVLDPHIGRVKVDPGQLDQILMNLAVNARDAMPRGGKLTVETAPVILDESYAATHPDCKPGPHVLLAMTDTGCGMPPEILARVFEPFFTTKEVGKGTGLGLAMVFGIVRQSEGCIHAYSEPGLGTTFKIYFPAVPDPTPRPEPPIPAGAGRGTETILLVEDEDGVRELTALSLETYGYRVLTAADGRDALRVARSHEGPLDLLLTDVVMPNSGGPELAAALRLHRPQLKVLFMSGYTDDAVVRHGLLEAEVSFLQKPFAPPELARKVRQVLDEPNRPGN